MVRGAINTALGLTKVGVVVRTMGGGEKVPRTELNFIPIPTLSGIIMHNVERIA